MSEQPLLCWTIPITSKIRIFMWLTFKNRILIKINLRKKGWEGNVQCVSCSYDETVNHMFLQCGLAKQIWYWLGLNQLHYNQWKSMKDVFKFALNLSLTQRQAFLLVFSETCWTI